MDPILSLSHPLENIFRPHITHLYKQVLLVIVGVVVLFIASQLNIPFHPVPLTFQSAAVVLLGLAYGARLGVATVITYLLAGAYGLPVFADFTGGVQMFADPSVGYLLGFIPAVLITGYLTQKGWGRSITTSFLAATAGIICLFAVGTFTLALFVGFHIAYLVGLKPFFITEPVKLLVVSFIAPRFWKKR